MNSRHDLSRCDSSHFLILIHLAMSSAAVCTSSEHAMELEDMKHVVHLLHTALHQPEHHLLKERELLEKLDNLKQELSPLEKVGDECWVFSGLTKTVGVSVLSVFVGQASVNYPATGRPCVLFPDR